MYLNSIGFQLPTIYMQPEISSPKFKPIFDVFLLASRSRLIE